MCLHFSINIDNVDAFGCSIPDVVSLGGNVTEEAVEASSSLILNCINNDRESRAARKDHGLSVPVRHRIRQ